jgi:L-lactate dehydrogenase complex protein LldG
MVGKPREGQKAMSPMSSRDEIIARIQRSFAPAARSSDDDHAAISRDYVQTGTLDPAARLDLFEERLRDYGSEVYRCVTAQLPETIATAMNAACVRSLVIADDIGPNWLPSAQKAQKNEVAPSFVRDQNLSYETLDRSEGILTSCAVAVALTGTIILRHGRSGRRGITLIPDYHLCVVRASQVVETVPEAIRELESPARAPITTVSGPSATADIEMTRIKGVHGPRRLAVILVVA